MAARPQSLQDYLAKQLGEMELTDAKRKLARHICAFIDRTGYVGTRLKVQKDSARKSREGGEDPENEYEVFRPIPLAEIAALYDELTTPGEVEDALVRVVQKLDPPGVGARTMAECLLLQIGPHTPHRDALRVLVRDHLDDIANNRVPLIHKATKFEIRTIQEAIEALSHFDPKPGLKFAEAGTQHVIPDVIVEDVANREVKQKLIELVADENKANPLSDEELVARLIEVGYPVDRRTVTKYRKMLNIPSSRQRKDWSRGE